MRLWRAFPWDPGAGEGDGGHPLYVPRAAQGGGRHDNPLLYGALYLSEEAVAAVGELLAHLRGQWLEDPDLERSGRRLALVPLEAEVDGRLFDLDDPAVLLARSLAPSRVATGRREVTQRWAQELFRARPQRAGIRWWSTLESSWLHVTLFDRAVKRVSVPSPPEPLRTNHPVVRAAADALGIAVA